MTTDKEFEAFRAMMLSQFARLAENAGRYIGRMSSSDRHCVLYVALEMAWQYRQSYNPARQQLPAYWDWCMREAVGMEGTIRLRRTADWEALPSELFLTRIPAVGAPSDE